MKKNSYHLEWFDLMVTSTLKPLNYIHVDLSQWTSENIITRLENEKLKVQVHLNRDFFNLRKEDEIRTFVTGYHSALIFLIDISHANFLLLKEKAILKKVYNEFIRFFNEMLSFIEIRFSVYLSLNKPVPENYVLSTKRELKEKLQALKKTLPEREPDEELASLVLLILEEAIAKEIPNTPFSHILYLKELVGALENMPETPVLNKDSHYSPLTMLLVLHDFNSLRYMEYLTNQIKRGLQSMGTVQMRIEELLLLSKDFNELHVKANGMCLNPSYSGLKTKIADWFETEIDYLEKGLEIGASPIVAVKVNKIADTQPRFKVRFSLSGDQISILLVGGKNAKILEADNLTEIYKTMVPNISSKHMEDLSWESMRKKAYEIEKRDKDFTIEALYKIIAEIKKL